MSTPSTLSLHHPAPNVSIYNPPHQINPNLSPSERVAALIYLNALFCLTYLHVLADPIKYLGPYSFDASRISLSLSFLCKKWFARRLWFT